MGLYGVIDGVVVTQGSWRRYCVTIKTYARKVCHVCHLQFALYKVNIGTVQHTAHNSFFPSRDILWMIRYSSNVISTWTTDKILFSNPIPDCNVLCFLGMPQEYSCGHGVPHKEHTHPHLFVQQMRVQQRVVFWCSWQPSQCIHLLFKQASNHVFITYIL